jgi:hypothetical protein
MMVRKEERQNIARPPNWISFSVLFEIAPRPEETLRTLSVVSLICGLLTSVVASILMNGSYDEFSSTIKRWNGNTNYGVYGRAMMEDLKDRNPDFELLDKVNYGELLYLYFMVRALTQIVCFHVVRSTCVQTVFKLLC